MNPGAALLVDRRRPGSGGWPLVWLLGVTLAAGPDAGAATESRPTVLPAPTGDPLAIDFSRDPLLAFGRGSGPSQPFLTRLGEVVEKHPAVTKAVADRQAADAIRVQVRSGLFPRLDTQLLYNRTLSRDFGDRQALVESLQPRVRTDLSVTGEQLVYDFGATGNRIAAANERILAARAEVGRVADETALRAIAAWYEVLQHQTLVDLSMAMAARQQTILGDVRKRFDQGVGSATDVSRADAVLAQTLADAARFKRLLGQARGRYREAFGEPVVERLRRVDPPRSAAASGDAAQALARQAPEVVAARHSAEAAVRDYRGARAAGLPRLSLGISGTRYNVLSASDYEVRGNVVLRQSLSAGGRQRGIVAEALARSDAANSVVDRIVGEAERDADAAFSDIAALEGAVTSLETSYVANRRVRDSYVEQFRISRGSLIELLRTEQDYLSAAAAYVRGVIDLDVARYTLLARTGEILPVIGIELG